MNRQRSRRPRGKKREERVVEAAARAITELGLANVRMADIAERAGMSPGHVAYYFGSKTHLLMEAIRWSEESFRSTLVEDLRALTDPWEQLLYLIDVGAPTGPGDPGWVLWFEVWSAAALDPHVAAINEELDGWWLQTMSAVIAAGLEMGRFASERPPSETAIRLLSLIDGLSVRTTLGSQDMTRARMLQICREIAQAELTVRETSTEVDTIRS